jgi:hypothetical protein
MPKKLSPEQVTFRQTLEALRKQYEIGLTGQSKQVEAALGALRVVKNDIILLARDIDNVIKIFETEETGNGNTEEKPETPDQQEQPSITITSGDGTISKTISPDQLEQELFGESAGEQK